MPTKESHVIRHSDCIWLHVVQLELSVEQSTREILTEAKELAISANKTVRFMSYSSGKLFTVTATSDIEQMLNSYMNKNNTNSFIE